MGGSNNHYKLLPYCLLLQEQTISVPNLMALLSTGAMPATVQVGAMHGGAHGPACRHMFWDPLASACEQGGSKAGAL